MGTHIDAPRHFLPNGATTAEVDLSAYIGEAVCIAATDFPHQGVYDLTSDIEKNAELIHSGDIVLLYTGYEKLLGTPEYFEFTEFHENTGALLESYGIKGLGFDASTIAQARPTHQEVLGRGIGIIESLIGLEALIGKRFFFSAAPLKFEDGDGSPVRAYAITED
jgi:kynurenine formamidase